jgi:hypothetical protein
VSSALVAASGAPAPLAAQERGLFTVGAAAGLAGAFDSGGEKAFDHSAWQLSGGMLTDDRTWTMLRWGRIDLDEEELPIGRASSEIEYLNLAGEFKFRQPAYEFGIFVGVGAYQLDAELVPGGPPVASEEEAIGLAAGLTGDFDVTARLSVVAELDVHYVFFDETNAYGSGLVGLAVHF